MSAPSDPPAIPVTFRPVRTRVVLLTVGSLLVVTFTVVAFTMPDPHWTASDRNFMIAVGVLMFALLALLSRPKLVATRAGLTVINLTTIRRLEWPQILGVNLRPGDPWVYLDLADGTSLPAMGIQPGAGKSRAIRDAGALRALVEAYGTSPSAGG